MTSGLNELAFFKGELDRRSIVYDFRNSDLKNNHGHKEKTSYAAKKI